MKTASITKNWAIGTSPDILENIHQQDVNIAIWNRNADNLKTQISYLLNQNIQVRINGNIETILESIKTSINPERCNQIIDDIKLLLELFKKVSGSKTFKLFLATVNTNMCRRFHTDINDIRLLCTYYGPGTLWLKEDNIKRDALSTYDDNDSIVINENKIQQAQTGSIVLLKGAIYPAKNTKAIVHRSPTIEESGEKRLLIRIDSDQFLNFNT